MKDLMTWALVWLAVWVGVRLIEDGGLDRWVADLLKW